MKTKQAEKRNRSAKTLRAACVLCLIGGSAPAGLLAQEGATESAESSTLELTELTVCRGVEDGQAVDPTDSFTTNRESIYALVRVKNPERADTHLYVSFVKEGREGVRGRQLAIAGRPRVRTVARTSSSYLGAGSYKVIVRDADGTVLGERPFTVQ